MIERTGDGRPDEDTRDGLEHGGWGARYGDEAIVAKMGERMGGERAFLFGRRTYEQLLGSWNTRGGRFKDALNDTPKYVASAIHRRGSTGPIRPCCTATSRPPSRSSSCSAAAGGCSPTARARRSS